MRLDKIIAVLLGFCVCGFHSLRSQSLPGSAINSRTTPQLHDSSQTVQTVPRVYRQPLHFANVRVIPRLGGCWRGTIRARDVTEQVVASPFQLGPWADEDYRICFGYDLHPQVSVAVTELKMRSSRSDIVRADDSQVVFTNYLVLADHDRGSASRASFEIEQTTEFEGRSENGRLVVTATAIGQRDWRFAYRTAWQATFYKE